MNNSYSTVFADQPDFVRNQLKRLSHKKCYSACKVHRCEQMITFARHFVAKSSTENAMAASEVQKSEKISVTLKKSQVQHTPLLYRVSMSRARCLKLGRFGLNCDLVESRSEISLVKSKFDYVL